jgi:hypothetical protein
MYKKGSVRYFVMLSQNFPGEAEKMGKHLIR